MSNVVNRYLKLNTAWASVRWVAQLSDGGMLGWLAIQNHAKAHGMNGVVNAVDPWVLAQQNFIKAGEPAVQEAIDKAIANGALRVEGETWVLPNWDKEQGDPTGAERQKRWRESQKEPSDQPGEPDRNADNALRNARNAENRREENTELESSGEDSNSARERALSETSGPRSRMKAGEFPVFWAKFQAAYPDRAGGQVWKVAREKAVAKIKAGADPCLILSRAEAFADWCRAAGIFGTGRVPMPATWLNQERWLEDFGDPAKAGTNAARLPAQTSATTTERAYSIADELARRETARSGQKEIVRA